MTGRLSQRLTERRIERLLSDRSDREQCEPPQGLFDRLRAEIPPSEVLGSAPLRAALEERRGRRLRFVPTHWLAAGSVVFALAGGALFWRLWQAQPVLRVTPQPATDVAPATKSPASASERPQPTFGAPAVSAPTSPPPPPIVPPVAAMSAAAAEEAGIAGGIVGGTSGVPLPAATPPLLDRQNTATATVVAEGELDKIPTSRDPWKTLAETPEVLTDRVNVGGNESGQQSVFVPAEAPDGKSGAAATPGGSGRAPQGPPPRLAEERPRPAGRAAEAPQRTPSAQAAVPYGGGRGVNLADTAPSSPPAADKLEATALAAKPLPEMVEARPDFLKLSRLEAATLPWRSGAPRFVVGLAAMSGERQGLAKQKDDEAGFERRRGEPRSTTEQHAGSLTLRFEPTAVLRARWLGEGAWRAAGPWETLSSAGRSHSTRLEIELRPGVRSEQVVAFVRLPETVRPLRLSEIAGGWERVTWDLRAAILKPELESALRTKGAALDRAETVSLLERARAVAATRPGDPRAQEIGRLAQQVEDASPSGSSTPP